MNNVQDFREHPANNAQSVRQLAHSFVYNQGILFDQREADRQQQFEQDYRLGLEERRREQWESYRKTFDDLRSQAALDSETLDVLNKIERAVSIRLSGEQAKDAELAQERQSAIDKKRLEMARSAEEQIPLNLRPLIKSVSKEVEANPIKFDVLSSASRDLPHFMPPNANRVFIFGECLLTAADIEASKWFP
jgi:hypothetical protein